MDPKEQEKLTRLVAEMATTVKELGDSEADRKQAYAKMGEDLKDHIAGDEEWRKTTTATIETISTDVKDVKANKDIDGQTAYDLVVKQPEMKTVCDMWGFSNPVERMMYAPKTKWSPKNGWELKGSYELSEEVMQMNDMLYLYGCQKVLETGANPEKVPGRVAEEIKKTHTYKLFKWELESVSELRKAMNTATSGEGSDWVPTGFSASLIDDIRLARKVSGMFGRITIPQGVGAFTSPIRGAAQRAYLLGEATSDSASNWPAGTPPTSSVTFTAIKQGLLMYVSDEMTEDSAIAVMPLVREEIVTATVDAEEDATLNGDTSTTHQDSNVTAATDVRKSWIGLRYHSGGSSGVAAVDISSLNVTNLRAIRKAMGRFCVNPAQGFWGVSISAYIQMLGITEVLTLDKIGPVATILNGQLGSFDGMPIIVSEFISQELTTAGVYDGATTTDTVVLLVSRPAFRYADKPGGIRVEEDRDIKVGQSYVVASRRLDFKQVVTPGSAEESVGLGYSLTS